MTLTHALAGQMLCMGGKAATPRQGAELSARLLADGSAFRRFVEMVELQSDDLGAAVAAFCRSGWVPQAAGDADDYGRQAMVILRR